MWRSKERTFQTKDWLVPDHWEGSELGCTFRSREIIPVVGKLGGRGLGGVRGETVWAVGPQEEDESHFRRSGKAFTWRSHIPWFPPASVVLALQEGRSRCRKTIRWEVMGWNTVTEVRTKGIGHVGVILCRQNSNICWFTSMYGQNNHNVVISLQLK